MDSSNPFVQTLSGLPIANGVHAHSIIPVKGDGPPEEGNDGVVEYKGAHIEGVESELVVRSGHSTQASPETIEEVRRILYEHAEFIDGRTRIALNRDATAVWRAFSDCGTLRIDTQKRVWR
jgi:hypothetical protein